MASFQKLPSGHTRAQVRRQGLYRAETFRTKALAQAWAARIETELDAGRLGQAKDGPLDAVFDRYEAKITSRKRGQQAEISRIQMFRAQWGATPYSGLAPEAIFGFAEARLDQGLSSDSVRRDLALLSSILGTAQELWGYGSPGPNAAKAALKVLVSKKLLRKRKIRDRRLRPGEYRRLLTGLKDSPTVTLLVKIALATGLRRGELLRLRPDHLRPDGLWVPDDKTEANATIPISRRARRLIGQMPPDGFGLAPDSALQALRRACRRMGIDDLRLHDLRHEALSRLFDRGLGIAEVALISRHADWRSLKGYSHLDRARVTEKLG